MSYSSEMLDVVPFTLEASAEVVASCQSCLSEDELARANRFVKPDVRRRFVVARGRLRQILAQRLGLAPSDVQFRYTVHGKPLLQEVHAESLHFNLSHSGEAGLVALSSDRPVGVDLERIRTCVDHRGLAHRFFSIDENRLLDALSGDEQRQAFFAIWTRKEAVIKALGVGLSLPLNRFSVGYIAKHTQVTWHGEVPGSTAANLNPQDLQVPLIELPGALRNHFRAAAAY